MRMAKQVPRDSNIASSCYVNLLEVFTDRHIQSTRGSKLPAKEF
jgi:hypothetical protein